MPKITQIRDIAWQASRSSSFPCFMCGEEEVTVRLRVEEDGSATVLNPCLGEKCASLPVEEIYQHFMTKRPK